MTTVESTQNLEAGLHKLQSWLDGMQMSFHSEKCSHAPCRGVRRIFGGGVPRGGEGVQREGGGVPRSAKEANNPNKRATELKPRTCAHQGSMFRP